LKFLFITDTHYRADKPKARTDDILETQFSELGDILHICKDREVDVVLHGGDAFNVKNPPHSLVVHLLNWVKSLHLPIYGILGNHDLTGGNLDSVKNTGLGVLFESGAFDKLDLVEFEDDKIVLKGVHHSFHFDGNYMFDDKYDGWTKIILSHNFIIPSETMPFGFLHPRDIKTNATFVLCGHYHQPWEYSSPTTRWINPGSISRWKVNERTHTPQAVLITIDGTVDIEYIPLPSAKQGKDLFDESLLEVEKAQERNIEQFAKSLESVTFYHTDIESVIRQAAKVDNISEEVLAIVLEKIRIAKEIL
jgi:DNA repair exonuclease SbcCD nuclease subunit